MEEPVRIDRCYNVKDFRSLARRRLPGPIFHYIDGQQMMRSPSGEIPRPMNVATSCPTSSWVSKPSTCQQLSWAETEHAAVLLSHRAAADHNSANPCTAGR